MYSRITLFYLATETDAQIFTSRKTFLLLSKTRLSNVFPTIVRMVDSFCNVSVDEFKLIHYEVKSNKIRQDLLNNIHYEVKNKQ